ncbi:hypothetical protein ANRL1_01449 [Anaerolineae bacterium]|nr:hypothetical protein ANRL1_01449 [Anaerolineae bacterium]
MSSDWRPSKSASFSRRSRNGRASTARSKALNWCWGLRTRNLAGRAAGREGRLRIGIRMGGDAFHAYWLRADKRRRRMTLVSADQAAGGRNA